MVAIQANQYSSHKWDKIVTSFTSSSTNTEPPLKSMLFRCLQLHLAIKSHLRTKRLPPDIKDCDRRKDIMSTPDFKFKDSGLKLINANQTALVMQQSLKSCGRDSDKFIHKGKKTQIICPMYYPMFGLSLNRTKMLNHNKIVNFNLITHKATPTNHSKI